MELDFEEGIELINESLAEEQEKRLWDEYLTLLPFMYQGMMEHMNYEDYKIEKGFTEKEPIEKLTQEEIFEDVEKNILPQFRK